MQMMLDSPGQHVAGSANTATRLFVALNICNDTRGDILAIFPSIARFVLDNSPGGTASATRQQNPRESWCADHQQRYPETTSWDTSTLSRANCRAGKSN